jgi:NAD(P)H-dependent FMN reductase
MKLLLLPGSRRQDSINVRLLQAVELKLKTLGVETDLVTSGELNAPIYDGDCEAKVGVPDSIKALNKRMNEANGIVVTSPEYNGFFSPLLKNTLDWMSRSQDDQPGTKVFMDKPALVLAASPGPMAAARALPHIRTQLSNLGLNVYRAQLGVGRAGSVLSDTGEITDVKVNEQVDALLSGFTEFASKLQ